MTQGILSGNFCVNRSPCLFSKINHMPRNITRRQSLKMLGTTSVALPLMGAVPFFEKSKTTERSQPDIHIFSKHLQWLDFSAMAIKVAEMGFDGTDLTVRPGGHVEPARVKEDLPKAIEQLRKAGLQATMITTSIEKVQDYHTEEIIKTASQLGISYYRMGWIKYDQSKPISKQLDGIKQQLKELETMNKHYQIRGVYQNHAGMSFGSAVWDLWFLLNELDSDYLGCQYDVRHAMVEGLNSWELGFDLITPFIKVLVVKDFNFTNEGSLVQNVPMGEGVVKWRAFFQKLKAKNINAPISLHCEYPLGGAEKGSKILEIPENEVLEAMKRDFSVLKSFF